MSNTLEEVQTYWQVASITHFFHCFHPKLKDNTFFYQDLEAALLDPEYSWNPKGGRLLDDIIEALVIMYWEDDMPSSISKAFRRMIREELVEADKRDNPLVEKAIKTASGEIRETWKDINILPVQTKLDIIQRMCDYVLSARPTIIKEFSVAKLRIRPVGTDSKGFAYWYFHGNRLYRQRFKALKVSVDRLEDIEEAKKTAIKEEIENKSKAKSKGARVGKDSSESNVKKKSPSNRDKSPTNKPSAKKSKTSKTSVVSRKISDYFVSSKSPSLDSIGSNLNLIAPRGPSKLEIKTTCDGDISKIPLPVKQELWSVICDTPIEWEELIRVLIASREKVDLQLSAKLVGYLPEVREAYDRKELTILGRDKRGTLRTRKDQVDKNLLLDKKLRSNLTPINYTELSGDEDESDENQVPPKESSSESENEESDDDEDSTGEENHERPNIRRSRRTKNIQTYHEKALAARYNKEKKKKRNAMEELPTQKKKTKATIIRERQTNF